MKVLSLFDGISCGRVALESAGIPVTQYIACDIDKYAKTVAKKNWPDSIYLDDVRVVRQMAEAGVFGHMDLLIGGSPCQGFSFAGKQLAFDDPRSALFFEFVKTLQALQRWNPSIRFMLENVKMKKEHLDVISNFLGVQPVRINSALVSAQNRDRYYWCNWPVSQPLDRGIYLRDIIDPVTGKRADSNPDIKPEQYLELNNSEKANALTTVQKDSVIVKQYPRGKNAGFEKEMDKCPTLTSCNQQQNLSIGLRRERNLKSLDEKSFTLLSSMHKGEQANGCTLVPDGITYRKLTPVECERLQTLPDDYTAGISNTQRYKALGNGWTVEVIAHILREMPR